MIGKNNALRLAGAFGCGALSVAGAAFCTALALGFTDEGFLASAKIIFLAHIPIMILEGIIVALAVSFIAKSRPELLQFTKNERGF
jgi:cobalt/nickel transport system permease protein